MLNIYHNDSLMYTDESGDYFIEDSVQNRDITGDGVPEVMIRRFSGGAHCCSDYLLFTLGDSLKLVQTIAGENSDLIDIKNLDSDKSLEITVPDWTFAYWGNADFANSPAPEVILKWDGKQFSPSAKLMKKSILNDTAIPSIALKCSEPSLWKTGYPPIELWGLMFDLIYSGNYNQAEQLFRKSCPPEFDTKKQEVFLSEFNGKLEESPYWKSIKKMNGL